MNNNYEQYAAFKVKQLDLAEMLGKASEVISELNMNHFRDNLKKLSDKVHNETFKIQVVGTFKNGKSTFINSFLGEEILPAYALPCTAVINELKWGEAKKAILYFRNPLPNKLPAEIPEKARFHMSKFANKDIPSLEIPYDEIEDYAVIPFGKDPSEMLLESPYEKIELFWPLPLLKNGVEIIDSPGLNEHKTRTEVTMNYLSKADAILFILNAQQICSQDEMTFIENNLKGQGFEDPFFVVNKFDSISDREKAAMKRFVQVKLDDYTSNEIFFVSARDALDGRMEGNEEKVKASGMVEFQNRLSDFLTKQKGKAKLAQPAKELKRILNNEALFKIIPRQREMLGSSLDSIKAKYESAQPKLADLKIKKDQLYHRLMLRIEQSKHEFRRVVNQNMLDLGNSVPVWIDEYTPNAKVGILPTKAKVSAVVSEIANYISQKVETEQQEWKNQTFVPVIQEKASDIFGSVEDDLTKLFNDIDNVQVDVSGKEAQTVNDVPAWSRIAGAVGGFLAGGFLGAAVGGVEGLSKNLAKTLALQVGSIFVLDILGCLNPFTLVALIIIEIIGVNYSNESRAIRKIKESVANEVIKNINASAEKNVNAIVNGISDKFSGIANEIASALDIEMNEADNQIKSIIAEMEKGKENIAAREAIIKECESKIKQLSTRLDNLIFQLVEG